MIDLANKMKNSSTREWEAKAIFSLFTKLARALIWVVAVVAMCVFVIDQKSLATLLVFFIFGGTGLLLSRAHGKTEARIYTLILAVSVIAAIALYYIYLDRYGTPYFNAGSDDLNFESEGSIVAKNMLHYDGELIKELIEKPNCRSQGYVYLVSLFIRLGDALGGFHTMMPRLFNCCLLSLLSIVIFSISKKLHFSLLQAKAAALVTGLFPMMIFTSIHTFRDIPIVLVLALGLKLSLGILQKRPIIFAFILSLLALPIFFVISEMRDFYLIALTAIFISAWIARLWPEERFSAMSIPLFLVALVILGIFIQGTDIQLLQTLKKYLGIYQGLLENRSPDGMSSYLFSLPPPFNYLVRFGYALVSPLPVWQNEIERNILGMGTIFQFMAVPFVFLGIKSTFRQLAFLPLLLMFLVLFGGYVFGTFTFRHITSFIPFAVLYGMIGYSKYKHLRFRIIACCTVVLALSGISYMILKI